MRRDVRATAASTVLNTSSPWFYLAALGSLTVGVVVAWAASHYQQQSATTRSRTERPANERSAEDRRTSSVAWLMNIVRRVAAIPCSIVGIGSSHHAKDEKSKKDSLICGKGPVDPEFAKASRFMAKHRRLLSVEDQLKLYGLFKQGMSGDCDVPEPSSWDMVAHEKWKAWRNSNGVEMDSAQKQYVDILRRLLPGFDAAKDDSSSNEGSKGHGDEQKEGMGIHASAMAYPLGNPDGADYFDESNPIGRLLAASERGDMAAVKAIATSGEVQLLEARDDQLMTPLHIASDRGRLEVVNFLCDKGADVNAQDMCGETPLHLAIAAEQREVVKELIARGANVNIKNRDGETCMALSEKCTDEEIRDMIQWQICQSPVVAEDL